MTDFSAVDAGDVGMLVALMDATDRWPAVRAVRAWVLAQTGIRAGSVVIDAGSGPGTFGELATLRGAVVIDVDSSHAMLAEARRRETDVRVACADVAALPVRSGCADLVRAERVLQWTRHPHAALDELRRAVAPGGWIAVTDTDWSTLHVDDLDRAAEERLAAAALAWVPHPRLASDLRRLVDAFEVRELHSRTDIVELVAWDPDDPAQRDGPPGLPLHSIVECGVPDDHAALDRDLEALAGHAREGHFGARVSMVTVLARRPDHK